MRIDENIKFYLLFLICFLYIFYLIFGNHTKILLPKLSNFNINFYGIICQLNLTIPSVNGDRLLSCR